MRVTTRARMTTGCDATPNPEVTMGYAGYGHHNAMSHGYDTMRHAGKNKL
jgi:hypothetical protein